MDVRISVRMSSAVVTVGLLLGLAACSPDYNDVHEYVDALLEHDFVSAASFVCNDVVIESGELERDFGQLEADEGQILGFAYGRGTTEVATLFLAVRKGSRKATVTYTLPISKEGGRWRPCPTNGHPLGGPTD